MAYALDVNLALGAGNTGLTLEMQLKDTAGVNVGAAVTSGFVDLTLGNYLFHSAAWPDGHRGAAVFQVSPGGAVKACVAINPEEAERVDTKVSTRSSHTAADVWAAGTRTLTSFGTLVADTATAVWASGTRTLTSFGTLVADIWANATRTLTSFGTLAADVWAVGTRTLTGFGTLVADVATAVWAAGTRTLTGFGTLVATTAAAVWDELRSAHLGSGSFGQSQQIVRSGTAQAGGATTITLDAGASAVNSFYDNTIIQLIGGTGVGQARFITGYAGATKAATVAAWGTIPDATTIFVILPFDSIPGATAPTAAQVADAVWDETLADHLLVGSTGEALDVSGATASPTGVAAAVWAYVTRTLTQAIAAVTPPPVITGDAVRVLRGETILLPFVNLGDLSARTKLWLTVKGNKGQPDTAALVQIVEGTGLVILNRQAATAAEGSITVTGPVVGNLTVRIEAAAAALLPPSDHYYYDVQMLSAAGVETLTSGSWEVAADVTRDIT